MKPPRAFPWTWISGGVIAGLMLHGVAGWWSAAALAQGSGNTTLTTSTTTSSSFESPPACSTVGSSRTVDTVTIQNVLGPGCIGIGNRNLSNPSPACAGLTPAAPPSDPSHGTVFLVVAGTQNLNGNTNTETIQCVAAVPTVPRGGLAAIAIAVVGFGGWQLVRRRPRVT